MADGSFERSQETGFDHPPAPPVPPSPASSSQPLDAQIQAALADLRRIAVAALASERPGHTLRPTALVNEFWLTLADRGDLTFDSREQFLAYATKAIRHILVDYGRRRNALRRGGGKVGSLAPGSLDHLAAEQGAHQRALIVAELLERLQVENPRAARVAEMRYFGQMNDAAIARVLEVSVRTVRNDWRAARAWLAAEMADESAPSSSD